MDRVHRGELTDPPQPVITQNFRPEKAHFLLWFVYMLRTREHAREGCLRRGTGCGQSRDRMHSGRAKGSLPYDFIVRREVRRVVMKRTNDRTEGRRSMRRLILCAMFFCILLFLIVGVA